MKKKLMSILLAGAMVVGMAGCGKGTGTTADKNNEGASGFDFSGVKIGILGYHQSGEVLDGLTAYMDKLSEEIGFEYEYVVGSSYDEQTNITSVQNLLSSGCNGIIYCMDSGTTTIVEECASAEVYLAGWECDFENSFDEIKNNPYFLGNVCDGKYDNSEIGEMAAQLAIDDGCRNIGIVTFPSIYYPHTTEAVDGFKTVIEKYNETAEEKIELYDTQELSFTELEDTYFSTYPEVDGILGLASGFVYPTMVRTGHTDVKLYGTGIKKDENDAFRNGEIRMGTLANIEAVSYPLALLLNQICGTQFADKPETAQRVDTAVAFVTSTEELDALNENSMLYTANADDSLISVEEFKEYLTAYNENASYEVLTARLLEMDMQAIMNN